MCTSYGLRSDDNVYLLQTQRTHLICGGDRAFSAAAPKEWNKLPYNVQSSKDLNIFKTKLKTHLFTVWSKIASYRHAVSPQITKKEQLYEIKCIICNNVKLYDDIREKYRICQEDSAQQFLMAVNYHNDDMKVRLADIDSVSRLIAADIYYHANCFRAYIIRYEQVIHNCILCMSNVKPLSINQVDDEKMVKLLEYSWQTLDTEITVRLLDYFDENQLKIKQWCYAHGNCIGNYMDNTIKRLDLYENYVQPLVNDELSKGYGLTLSDIRDSLSRSWPGILFHNHNI